MEQVGDFVLERHLKFDKVKNTTKTVRKVRLELSQTIMWPGTKNEAPKDSPTCGFEGERCPKPNKKDNSKSFPFQPRT